MRAKHDFTSIKDLLLKNEYSGVEEKPKKYISREFQDYGYRLAVKLDDMAHKSLYIKLAKREKRPILEQALSYTLDYPKAKNKAKIFMWKLASLRNEAREKKKKDAKINQTITLI